jgi:prophage DNA circulation protein
MTTVNNASGVYGTLGYNFNDPNGDIINLSANTQSHLNSMPAFITAGQAQLIVSSGNNPISQTALYRNPVSNVIQSIQNTASLIISIAAGTSNNSNNLINTASFLSNTANSFLSHTNRLSNLIPFDGTDTVNPYYQIATTLGKSAIYITNQTDGIINNSPILGSFTSFFIGPQLNANSIIISTDYSTHQTGIQNDTLTLAQYTKIGNDLNTVSLLMSTRQSADISFYTNLKNMINNYNTTKNFKNMGETESYLITNFIGTSNAINLMS